MGGRITDQGENGVSLFFQGEGSQEFITNIVSIILSFFFWDWRQLNWPYPCCTDTSIFYCFWRPNKQKSIKPHSPSLKHSFTGRLYYSMWKSSAIQRNEKSILRSPKDHSYFGVTRSWTHNPRKVPKTCHLLFCSKQKWGKYSLGEAVGPFIQPLPLGKNLLWIVVMRCNTMFFKRLSMKLPHRDISSLFHIINYYLLSVAFGQEN